MHSFLTFHFLNLPAYLHPACLPCRYRITTCLYPACRMLPMPAPPACHTCLLLHPRPPAATCAAAACAAPLSARAPSLSVCICYAASPTCMLLT